MSASLASLTSKLAAVFEKKGGVGSKWFGVAVGGELVLEYYACSYRNPVPCSWPQQCAVVC